RFVQSFVRNLVELSARDFLAFRSFLSVMHLISSPLRLIHPWLLCKLLWHGLLVSRPASAARMPRFVSQMHPGKLSPRPTPGGGPMASGDLSNSSSGLRKVTPGAAPSSLSGPMAPSAATPSSLWRDRTVRK